MPPQTILFTHARDAITKVLAYRKAEILDRLKAGYPHRQRFITFYKRPLQPLAKTVQPQPSRMKKRDLSNRAAV
jgi:hypothetical protein